MHHHRQFAIIPLSQHGTTTHSSKLPASVSCQKRPEGRGRCLAFLALWAQTQPERQLETAQQPCARVQKCHCSRLGPRERAPKRGQAAAGCLDRRRQSDQGVRADPRQDSQAHRQAEAEQRSRPKKDAVPVRAVGLRFKLRHSTVDGPGRLRGAEYVRPVTFHLAFR